MSNFIFFYNEGFLLKSGPNVYSFSNEGKTRFYFRLNSYYVSTFPVFHDIDYDGKKEIILTGKGKTWLLDDNGKQIGKAEYTDTVYDCLVEDNKIFLLNYRGKIWCYDYSMKRLWEFKNPDKLKTGFFLFDMFDLREPFNDGLALLTEKGGGKYLFAVSSSSDAAYVISEEGVLEKKIKLGLSESSGGIKSVMFWMASSSSRPTIYNGSIIFPASRVIGTIDKDSDAFHVEDYIIEMK